MILISIRRQALEEFRLKKNFSWPFLLFSFCLSGMQHLSCIVKDTTQVESQSFLAPRHLQVCLRSRSNFTYRYFKSIDGANYLLHSLTPDVESTYSLLTHQFFVGFFFRFEFVSFGYVSEVFSDWDGCFVCLLWEKFDTLKILEQNDRKSLIEIWKVVKWSFFFRHLSSISCMKILKRNTVEKVDKVIL